MTELAAALLQVTVHVRRFQKRAADSGRVHVVVPDVSRVPHTLVLLPGIRVRGDQHILEAGVLEVRAGRVFQQVGMRLRVQGGRCLLPGATLRKPAIASRRVWQRARQGDLACRTRYGATRVDTQHAHGLHPRVPVLASRHLAVQRQLGASAADVLAVCQHHICSRDTRLALLLLPGTRGMVVRVNVRAWLFNVSVPTAHTVPVCDCACNGADAKLWLRTAPHKRDLRPISGHVAVLIFVQIGAGAQQAVAQRVTNATCK